MIFGGGAEPLREYCNINIWDIFERPSRARKKKDGRRVRRNAAKDYFVDDCGT